MKARLPIDYTVLKPDTRYEAVNALCTEAHQQGYHGVCVPPCHLALATEALRDSEVRVCTVIDYPHGFSPAEVKVYAAQMAILDGAHELDIVINVGRLKSGNLQYVEAEIAALRELTLRRNILLKVIIEAALLSAEERADICRICANLEVDFVKNSTGVNGGNATPELIAELRQLLPAAVRIKASGGIRTAAQVQELLKAGADRIGTSAAIEFTHEFTQYLV